MSLKIHPKLDDLLRASALATANGRDALYHWEKAGKPVVEEEPKVDVRYFGRCFDCEKNDARIAELEEKLTKKPEPIFCTVPHYSTDLQVRELRASLADVQARESALYDRYDKATEQIRELEKKLAARTHGYERCPPCDSIRNAALEDAAEAAKLPHKGLLAVPDTKEALKPWLDVLVRESEAAVARIRALRKP